MTTTHEKTMTNDELAQAIEKANDHAHTAGCIGAHSLKMLWENHRDALLAEQRRRAEARETAARGLPVESWRERQHETNESREAGRQKGRREAANEILAAYYDCDLDREGSVEMRRKAFAIRGRRAEAREQDRTQSTVRVGPFPPAQRQPLLCAEIEGARQEGHREGKKEGIEEAYAENYRRLQNVQSEIRKAHAAGFEKGWDHLAERIAQIHKDGEDEDLEETYGKIIDEVMDRTGII